MNVCKIFPNRFGHLIDDLLINMHARAEVDDSAMGAHCPLIDLIVTIDTRSDLIDRAARRCVDLELFDRHIQKADFLGQCKLLDRRAWRVGWQDNHVDLIILKRLNGRIKAELDHIHIFRLQPCRIRDIAQNNALGCAPWRACENLLPAHVIQRHDA